MSDTKKRPTGQMLISSGRPDPRWTMEEKDWNKLNELIESLSENAERQGKFEQPSTLGYPGFVCEWKDEKSFYLAKKKQAVKVKTNSYIVYDDPSKSVELWLLDNAKTHRTSDHQLPSDK